MGFINGIKRKFLQLFQGRINSKNRKRLIPTNEPRTIISSNCNGGFISHYLGLRFESPTVNLFIKPTDFIKALNDFDKYFAPDAEIEEIKGEKDYPVGMLCGDVKIYFMHYDSFENAVEKWRERAKRINKNQLYVMMSERDGCTYEDLESFDKLPFESKVVFTHKQYHEIKSCYYIKGFENKGCVGELQLSMNILGKRYIDQFDYVSFLNRGEKEKINF